MPVCNMRHGSKHSHLTSAAAQDLLGIHAGTGIPIGLSHLRMLWYFSTQKHQQAATIKGMVKAVFCVHDMNM